MNKKLLVPITVGFAAIVFLFFKTIYTILEAWQIPAEADTANSPTVTPRIIREGQKYLNAYSGAIISKSSFKDGMELPLYYFALAPRCLSSVWRPLPELERRYFISGLAVKLIHRTVFRNKVFSHDERILENIGRVRDVKVGPDKFLYALTVVNGLVVRLLPVKR
jgi:hypothetical protein